MSILSIDVGIRHLSWVILDHQYNVTNNEIDIFIKTNEQKILWDIVDITPDQYNCLCNCLIDKKYNCKKTLKYFICENDIHNIKFYCENIIKFNNNVELIPKCIICDKKSLYYNNNFEFYCKKHSNHLDVKNIENCDCKNLCSNNVCNKQAICYNTQSNIYYCKTHKTNTSNKNLKQIDRNKLQIEEVFKSMVEKLDKILYLWKDVKIVLIEKQPPKNPRMKSIMSSLQSYFIIRGTIDKTPLQLDISNIHLINAKNKLNVYELNPKYPKVEYNNDYTKEGKKRKNNEYIKRKYLSIKYTENILNLLDNKIFYNYFIENLSKKDDLADCYLQGRYFIEYICSKNTINQHNQWNNYIELKIENIPKKFCFSDKVMLKKKILNLMSLKYILHRYPLTKENYDNYKYKNQITNSLNKFFGSVDFYFNK